MNSTLYQNLIDARQDIISHLERSGIQIDNAPDPQMGAELSSLRETEAQQLQSRFITLGRIDHALSKVGREDFGLCERCLTPISAKRLQAVPWANLCLYCQEEAEEENRWSKH